MSEICYSSSEDMATFYMVLKLHLFALSAFIRKLSNDQHQNISYYITDAQACIIKLIQKPNFGYDEIFGGKNCDKIKNEIEVC